MSQLAKLTPPRLKTLHVAMRAPGSVLFSGTITSKDPGGEVGPFLRAVHEAALADGLSEVRVDVSALTFVNPAAIRLFVDWTTWLRADRPYKLRFATNRHVAWQKACFVALKTVASELISVEPVD